MHLHRALLIVLVLVLLPLAPTLHTDAQQVPRTLHWPRIDITAHLDADGRLRVSERQTMVFGGAWNGGERTFNLRGSQKLEIHGMARIEPGGARVEMVEGDLGQVGHWQRVDDTTLRWRSRHPSDPPFEQATRVYVIEYTLSGILLPADAPATYRLDHEFGFADRVGAVGTLAVELSLDPAWQPASASVPVGPGGVYRQSWRDLAPGTSPVTSLVLTYAPQLAGGDPPDAAVFPLPFSIQVLPYLAALALMTLMTLNFARRQRDAARWQKLPDLAVPPDRDWLEEHVFNRPAEEVGALWDRAVGPPEVTAMLARMVEEGKLESWTEEPAAKTGWFATTPKPVLHLRLLAPRSELSLAEERLVDGLFVDGDETDTETVRKHYTGKGFDPAGKIRPRLEKKLPKRLKVPENLAPGRRWWTPALALATVLSWGLALLAHGELAVAAIPALPPTFIAYMVSVVIAIQWRRRVDWPLWGAAGFIVPLFAVEGMIALFSLLLAQGGVPNPGWPQLFFLLATALAPVVALSSALYQAASREKPEAVLQRRRLAHARRWFAAELARRSPSLEDAWVPYLLAFGLSSKMDAWWSQWGVAAPGDGSWTPGRTASTGSMSGGSSPSWTGGGGAFGGGGATAGWAAAAAGMASGVASPSSSGGGGGGGGGGGSSGGGGGGGW